MELRPDDCCSLLIVLVIDPAATAYTLRSARYCGIHVPQSRQLRHTRSAVHAAAAAACMRFAVPTAAAQTIHGSYEAVAYMFHSSLSCGTGAPQFLKLWYTCYTVPSAAAQTLLRHKRSTVQDMGITADPNPGNVGPSLSPVQVRGKRYCWYYYWSLLLVTVIGY